MNDPGPSNFDPPHQDLPNRDPSNPASSSEGAAEPGTVSETVIDALGGRMSAQDARRAAEFAADSGCHC